ncbi:MAG: hypothetical protein ACAI43_23195 [Phycisphaerae bacterium]
MPDGIAAHRRAASPSDVTGAATIRVPQDFTPPDPDTYARTHIAPIDRVLELGGYATDDL